jgi:hypothetical protein
MIKLARHLSKKPGAVHSLFTVPLSLVCPLMVGCTALSERIRPACSAMQLVSG